MKKLLITTMAAVSVGLCAKAADAIDASTFTENGTSFDDLTTGADFAGDNNFWQTPEGEGDLFKIIDVVYPEGATPQHWALATQEKALSIDTATPIFRNVNPVSDGNPPLDVSKKSVFFDSVVQFTATDVAPSMENNTTDKLAVWLYQSPEDVSGRLFEEESVITELVITAADSSDPTKTKHYPTGISVDPDSWHRLTIKSFNDEIGDLFFNVWVDKTQVKVGDTVNFKSLIDDTEDTTDGCYKLQGVAFDGKGAVDDIVFTTTEPEFAKESGAETYAIFATCDNASVSFSSDEGGEEPLEDVSALDIKTTVVYGYVIPESGYEVTSAKFNGSDLVVPEFDGLGYTFLLPIGTPKNGDEYAFVVTVTETTGGGSGEDPEDPEEPEEPAKPTIGGDAMDTADAFIAAANSGATIKVPAGWTLDGNTLKDADLKEYATFADYYTVKLADGTVTLELNDKAKPEIDETSADKGDAIVVTDAAVALGVTNAKTGLWYGAQAYSDAACTTKIGDEPTGWEKADGETVTVTATKPEADKAFFKVVVTDIAPKSTEE